MTSRELMGYDGQLEISDIMEICKEYNKLGWQVQNQIENILQLGVKEAISRNVVKKESLPFIKNFLEQIIMSFSFEDAAEQANECLNLIQQYEEDHLIEHVVGWN